jgi:hypothetical protein
MARTPEQLQAELENVYGKQTTARLKRKVFYLERARDNELVKNIGADISQHRREYFSHRLLALEATLEGRGVELDELGASPPDKYRYRGNMRRKSRECWPPGAIDIIYDDPRDILDGCWSVQLKDVVRGATKQDG